MPDELTPNAMQLGTTSAAVEESSIVLTIELVNDSDRTMHAYQDARRVVFDDVTGVLHVGLTDRAGEDNGRSSSYVMPNFTSIDPHGMTTITVRVPRVLTRIAGASGKGGVRLERIAIDQAAEVSVEVAWSDTPFYPDPRRLEAGQAHPSAALRRWERGVAIAQTPLRNDSATERE
jgi:hypothetical protein